MAGLSDLKEVQATLEKVFEPIGLDLHPFQIGWYNELVGPKFFLDYPPGTLAFVVISGPDTFEKCVIPYLKAKFKDSPNGQTNDPLDDAMVDAFRKAKQELKDSQVESIVFHDFELHPSRRPKVLVQTAAHVAGAVQYFHKNLLPQNFQKRLAEKSDLCGVAVHPNYGGWFAIRGIFIVPDFVVQEEMERPPTLNLIPDEEMATTLLQEFAYNWEADKWRTVYKGTAGIEYSEDFKHFLAIPPGQRWQFIRERGFLQTHE